MSSGGDAYSVSAFQNHHHQAQPRTVCCCRGRLPKRRTAVQRVRPENEILQQEERTCPRRDHAAGKYASEIMAFPTTILVDRNGNIVGEPMLGGIDNKDNYDALMKQIQSVIDADSTNK